MPNSQSRRILSKDHAEEETQDIFVFQCVPVFNFKPWENAKPKSFYARDNVENFTRWCRRFGVNESVLFESDGLGECPLSNGDLVFHLNRVRDSLRTRVFFSHSHASGPSIRFAGSPGVVAPLHSARYRFSFCAREPSP